MLLLKTIPPEIHTAHAALRAALDRRQELVQRQSALAAREPQMKRAADDAVEAHEKAATDLALATDRNHAELKKLRDEKRQVAEEAVEAHEMVRRGQRGIVQQLAEADDEIARAHEHWQKALAPFQAEVRKRFRRELVNALTPVVKLLRLGHAIEHAFPRQLGLGQMLREIQILDPVPQIGRVAKLISGHTAWLDEDDPQGNSAEDLRLFEADPETSALHALLRPLGQTELAAAARLRSRQYEKAREVTAQPAVPVRERSAADIENERVQKMSDEEYREYRREQNRKDALYPPYNGAGRFTYSEGRVR